MNENFLKKFIEEERYLQNPPLRTKDFIAFCKKRGILTDENELEVFEKERLLYPILRVENPRNSIGNHHYITILFQDFEKNLIISLFKENKIFDPSKVKFQPHSTFKDTKFNFANEKFNNYYSTFQIYWLKIIKETHSFNIELSGDKKIVHSHATRLNGLIMTSAYVIEDFKELEKSLEKRKKTLMIDYDLFGKVLEFLLTIQEYYYPFGRSGSRTINIRVDSEKWWEKRRNFDLKKELKILKTDIKQVSFLYQLFSKLSMEKLGIKRDDWIQLWKNIAWSEKDNLEGNVRLGIEYLQWALMLKRFIEDYCEKEILDIDEISNIGYDDILKYNPPEMDQYGMLLRASRNKMYFDPKENKSHYNDRYKRLLYLANDFNIDYQPRIMVFVEGNSEEEILPIIFEWYFKDKPENHGIEIVNFKGVDKLLSTSKNAESLKMLIGEIRGDTKGKEMVINNDQGKKLRKLIRDLEKTDIVISNWTSFISYNLEKWQIIPFFVSDNEGNVKHFLDTEKPIKFKGKNYNVPDNWKFLFGVNNKNKPFYGKDLEFANFNNKEIASAICSTLNETIDVDNVKKVRKNGEGINKIHTRISDETGAKVEIIKMLFKNLFNKYEETEDELILERPIFRVIEKIVNLAKFNHPPVNTNIEIENNKYILSLLEGKRKFKD